LEFIYSPRYNVDLRGHVFPTIKYNLVKNHLVQHLGIEEENFIQPQPARSETVCLVHTRQYFRKLETNSLSLEELLQLEIPMDKAVFEASLICVEGSCLAAHLALDRGLGVHIGGGFHHAFPDHGEGFCVFNDMAVAIRKLQKEKLIRRALVIDCDLHQGNGTAFIFRGDSSVFTFSIHQENNYPIPKPSSSLDIGLADGVGDEIYLNFLRQEIPPILKKFKPDFIMYQAGADPYEKDQLGGLRLTKAGLRQRDRIVFGLARDNHIPIAVTLGGGYAFDIRDTVEIHCNTILEGINILS
jgi:acetoin utilization deacetylase AcuC-like enzyme